MDKSRRYKCVTVRRWSKVPRHQFTQRFPVEPQAGDIIHGELNWVVKGRWFNYDGDVFLIVKALPW